MISFRRILTYLYDFFSVFISPTLKNVSASISLLALASTRQPTSGSIFPSSVKPDTRRVVVNKNFNKATPFLLLTRNAHGSFQPCKKTVVIVQCLYLRDACVGKCKLCIGNFDSRADTCGVLLLGKRQTLFGLLD